MDIEQKQLELDEISAHILAIHMIAQNIHYKAKGKSFWAVHKLMQLPIDIYPNLTDKIYEEIFMPSDGLEIPKPKYRLKHAVEICEDYTDDLDGLCLLITHTMTLLDNYKSERRAENAVMDEISSVLSQIKGFIKATLDTKEQKFNVVGNSSQEIEKSEGVRINTTSIMFRGKK